MTELPYGERAEGTTRGTAPSFHPSGKAWRPFRFSALPKITGAEARLTRQLPWLLPADGGGHAAEAIRARLKDLLEQDVCLALDHVHTCRPRDLRKLLSGHSCLAVLSTGPQRPRGLLELDLSLAHAAVDVMLGGAGEWVALRPLTEIEEGVLGYLLLEVLRVLAPSLDPGLPRLRLEGMTAGLEGAQAVIGQDPLITVVQLKAAFGEHAGYVRLFIPSSVLAMGTPAAGLPGQRERRRAELVAHQSRLSAAQGWLRAEIGHAEILAGDLAGVQPRDVVLLDEVTARPDRGEGGTVLLKLGRAQIGWMEAELILEEGSYKARIGRFVESPLSRPVVEEEPAPEALEPDGDPDEESTTPGALDATGGHRSTVEESNQSLDGADLLNDVPLQLSVELARIPVTAEDVVGFKTGEIVDLGRVPNEPVDLSVNGKVVGRGELVEVDGHLGVRITSLAG